jgi:hypothetical protein
MKKIETIDKRKEFLMKHNEVDVLLINLKFKRIKGYSVDNYNYSFYKNYINDLYSVEKYYNEILNLSFIFIRDRGNYNYLWVNSIKSDNLKDCLYKIEDFKKLIIEQTLLKKQTLLDSLNLITI